MFFTVGCIPQFETVGVVVCIDDFGEHLASLLLGDGERWMAVMTAFLDESGTNDKLHCVSVAGFFGNQDQWKEFRRVWKPHSAGFHALNSAGSFPLLCEAIEASQIHGVVITLWKDHYKQLATDHMRSFMGNPYAICSFICAMQICEEVNTPTSFVFEQGQPNFEFVERILNAMMDSGEYCIASVTGAKKTDFIELHPADFISHCMSTYKKPPLQRLFDGKLLKHGHIQEDKLREVAPELTKLVHRARKERMKAKKER
jgi:hypothetical protein